MSGSKGKTLTLGVKIKALRIAKGLTQGELTRGEITPGLISQIESDRVAPSLRVISLLAEQLGVETSTLVNDVEKRSVQMQALKEAREYLELNDGTHALPLLLQLQDYKVSYIPSMEVQFEIAYAYQLIGDFEKALSLYAEVEQFSFAHSDHQLSVNCMNRQGDMYSTQGNLPLALYCYRRALSSLLDIHNPPIQAVSIARKNVSVCLYRMGDTDLALQYAKQSYNDLQGSPHMQELAEICHILSVLYVEYGHHDQALQFAMDAVSVYRSLGLIGQLVDAKMNHAIVLREIGDYTTALRMLPGIISDYYAQGRTASLANAWNERALCELLQNQFDDALRSLERSLALADPRSTEHAETLRIAGQLYVAQDRTQEAITSFESALSIFQELNLITTSMTVLRYLKELYERIGQTAQAYQCHERVCSLVALIEEQRNITRITA